MYWYDPNTVVNCEPYYVNIWLCKMIWKIFFDYMRMTNMEWKSKWPKRGMVKIELCPGQLKITATPLSPAAPSLGSQKLFPPSPREHPFHKTPSPVPEFPLPPTFQLVYGQALLRANSGFWRWRTLRTMTLPYDTLTIWPTYRHTSWSLVLRGDLPGATKERRPGGLHSLEGARLGWSSRSCWSSSPITRTTHPSHFSSTAFVHWLGRKQSSSHMGGCVRRLSSPRLLS